MLGGTSKIMHHCIFGRLHIVASQSMPKNTSDSRYYYWDISNEFVYDGFCDDFGPMNLGTVLQFCERLDQHLHIERSKSIAVTTSTDPQALTNAAFLVGAYMMIRLDQPPSKVAIAFTSLRDQLISFRDVSPGEQNFHLHLDDCWQGLWRALELGWIESAPNGSFDLDEYLHYDDPLNADLHQVVPGKFIAMKGPRSLPRGKQWRDRDDGYRDFSPAYYVEILQEFNVQVVVRLNEPQYDTEEFTTFGIALADLRFEDCTNPPPEIEAKFLAIAEGVPAMVAVHCKAGLGRTGTLIALYMMKHHDFTARQAIGWLRIVRPGSVIGSQQQYLCEREAAMLCQCADPFSRRPSQAACAPCGAEAAAAVPPLRLPSAESVHLCPLPDDATPDEVMEFVASVTSESVQSLESRGMLLAPAAAAGGDSPRAKDSSRASAELAWHVAQAMERRNGRRGASPTNMHRA